METDVTLGDALFLMYGEKDGDDKNTSSGNGRSLATPPLPPRSTSFILHSS